MSKKIVIFILALASLTLLFACGNKNAHDHVRGDAVREKVIAPTCTEDGSYDEVVCCQKCSYEFDRKTVTVKAEGHNYVDYVCTVCKKEAVPSVGLEFKSNGDGTCRLKGIGVCTDTEIIVPKTSPEGDVVTVIGNAAFRYNSTITSLLMPDSVTEIKNSAFESCRGLVKINISKSTESIGENAFKGCELLASIVIPDSVRTIGDDAFSYCGLVTAAIGNGVEHLPHELFRWCADLRQVTIGNAVSTMGEYVFSDCPKLAAITVAEENTVYKSVDGSLYTKDGIVLVKYAVGKSNTFFEIPEGVEEIAPEAFTGCTSLMHLNIHDGVTSIGAHAFWECTSLTHVVIGASVSELGDGAFYGCRSLYKVTNKSDLPLSFGSDSNGYLACYAKVIADKDGNLSYNNQGAQYTETEDGFLFEAKDGKYILIAYLKPDKSAVLPLDFNGSEYTVEDLRGVHNLIIPDGATKIPTHTFLGCETLYSVVIPATVTEIGDAAFRNCFNLLSIEVAEYSEYYKSVDGNLYTLDGKTLLQYAIGKSEEAFAIPDGVENILPYALSSSKFTAVSIPDSVVSIGDYAFFCSRVTDLTLPAGVKNISKYAFSHMSELKTVVIKADGVSIGDSAFVGCSALESAVMEKRVANMEPYAFRDCTSLAYVVIGEGTTSIGQDAFIYCSNLTVIVLPTSLTVVEAGAFTGCTALTVYFKGTAAEWDSVSTGEYNYQLDNSPVCYYSEIKPSTDGSYWHYDESGKAVIWQ